MDTQDRQDKQDERLRHRKRTSWIIECAFVGNLRVLRGPSRTPFESFPTPWSPLANSSLAPLTDPKAPLVEISFAFPTFGGSRLSLLQPLSGPSSSFVPLRGYLFLAFVDNPQLFQISPVAAAGQRQSFRVRRAHGDALHDQVVDLDRPGQHTKSGGLDAHQFGCLKPGLRQ